MLLIMQYDQIPHEKVKRSIELFGTEVCEVDPKKWTGG